MFSSSMLSLGTQAIIDETPSSKETSTEDSGFVADDAAYILTCAFLVLTMQTGFAMLECGCVSSKNVANIMMKNVCDFSIGGFAFWAVGYGLAHGSPSTWFCGFGHFFLVDIGSIGLSGGQNSTTEKQLLPTTLDHIAVGKRYVHFIFHFSFASTATTIVSGAVAERIKLKAYMVFSFFNIIIYSVPCAWIMNEKGWLRNLNYYDYAGVSFVHLSGGTSALVATLMLTPRRKRFETPELYKMSSPVTTMAGMFMLMWAWLGFNCGASYGISGRRWEVAALVSVTTIISAIGGSVTGILLSFVLNKGQLTVECVSNSVLGGLVAITGSASVVAPAEAFLIGILGATFAILAAAALIKLHIDDPVGASPVHLFAGIWGTMAIGLFGRDGSLKLLHGDEGLFHGGPWWRITVQAIGCGTIMLWSAVTTYAILLIVRKTIGLRLSEADEQLGADFVEHGLKSGNITEKFEQFMTEMSTAQKECDKTEQVHYDQPLSALVKAINEVLVPQDPKPQEAPDTVSNNATTGIDSEVESSEIREETLASCPTYIPGMMYLPINSPARTDVRSPSRAILSRSNTASITRSNRGSKKLPGTREENCSSSMNANNNDDSVKFAGSHDQNGIGGQRTIKALEDRIKRTLRSRWRNHSSIRASGDYRSYDSALENGGTSSARPFLTKSVTVCDTTMAGGV